MSDALWAARLGDGLLHTSVMADILGGVLEVAANIAITALATAAVVAATGITVVTGGLGCFVLGAVVGIIVGVGMSKTGADKGLTNLCDWVGSALFPPVVMATIATGSHNTFTNGIPAARAAGAIGPVSSQPAEGGSPEEASYLDMAKGFFAQMWRPTVAVPAAGAVPKPLDIVICTKHPPMPPQFIAEGSSKVTINGQPAARSGDRSTCDASIVESGMISSNVRIGGGPVVVREIRSGKTPGVGLAVTALLMLRGGGSKFFSKLPCMVVGGLVSWGTSQVTNAITSAVVGSPNPVHSATGAKVLDGADDLDFALPGLLPIEWRRFYSSRDERRNGLFGAGWSVIYEVFVEIGNHPEGGEQLIYTDEQARQIDMGVIPLGGAVFSAGEGLSVRRNVNGQLLIESAEGIYRLFEPTPGRASRLRLSQLGDRNDNRIYLDYDAGNRLVQLRDTVDLVRIELTYSPQWSGRVTQIERLYADQSRELLVSYAYDAAGDLAQVQDAVGQVQRQFAYDAGRRMVEHQLPAGLRCHYQWAYVEDAEWRVVRHWTDEGDEYRFDYDLQAGITRITDGLQRVSTRGWNPQYQITDYTDTLGHTWQFDWNDERQLLGAVDPNGGKWQFSYDESGNLCGTEDPLGRRDSTLWLAHWALPLVETDAAGHIWHYQYDQRGNCVSETDPLGHVTRYRYDAFGQVVEIIDATGKSKTLRWNEVGQVVQHTDCSGYPTAFEYNRQGFLQAAIDALGERVRYRHDHQGRLLHTELSDGRVEQYQRDASGQLIAYIDAAGATTRYQYGRRGQVRQRMDAHGRQVELRYDAYGRLQTLTNENGEHYCFSWDIGDRLSEQQDLDGSVRRYTYDVLDNLATVELSPSGVAPLTPIIHRLQRDAVGRLRVKTTDDGRTEYAYDPLDQLTGVTFTGHDGSTQALAFAYDPLGQLLTEQNESGSLHHHYDELGNLSQSELPDGRWLNRLYYGSGHLHQINLDGVVISDFERDRLHREVLRTQGQINTRSHYDRNGRLQSRLRRPHTQPVQLPAARQKHFNYDAADNLIERNATDNPAHRQQHQHLHYDATGRVIASQDNTGQRETFVYDAAANLLDGTHAPGGLVRHNQLLTYQDKRYRYDGFGRLIEKRSALRGVQRFAYDAEHRLIEVRSQKGQHETIVEMTYDPLGRRIAKAERDANGHVLGETRFTWDGLRLLQEQKHGQTSLYLYEGNGYEPLARVDGTGPHQQVRYYHNDLNGLPEQLTEADGREVWRARYQVWGNTLEEVREPYYIEEQNLRFQGQYLDRETGLHYNTFRFYDPQVGRFTSPDPIGLYGGLNLYAYAPNPDGYADPLGLSCGPSKGFARKATIAKRWVGKLTGKKPADLDSYLSARGWTKSYPQAGRPDAIQHVQFSRTTKSGATYKLDYHPGGNKGQQNVHGNDYWKVYKVNKSGEDVVFGRIGHGGFKNYDLIKDSPVFVNGTLMNGSL